MYTIQFTFAKLFATHNLGQHGGGEEAQDHLSLIAKEPWKQLMARSWLVERRQGTAKGDAASS